MVPPTDRMSRTVSTPAALLTEPATLKVPTARLPDAVAQMQESRERLEKQLASLLKTGVDQTAGTLVAKAEQLDGAKLVVKDVGDYDQQILRGVYVDPASTEVEDEFVLDPRDPHVPVGVPPGFHAVRANHSWLIFARCA